MRSRGKTAENCGDRHRMSVVPDWLRIVGADVAAIVTPVAIIGTTLVLRATEWSGVERGGRQRARILERLARHGSDVTDLLIIGPGCRVVADGSRRRAS